MKARYLICLPLALAAILLSGCTTKKSYDYTAYQAHPPTSILVLPSTNRSVDVNAPNIYLSTITQPLAEDGYYVFPVAVVDQFMKANGVSDPAEMQAVPLAKLKAVFNPDAVLYTAINDWGQKYHILSSDTTVDFECRLVDASTGSILWKGHIRLVQDANQVQGGLLAEAIGAAVAQIAGSTMDYTRQASATASTAMIDNPNTGLPYGPYSPQAAADPRR